MSDLIKSDVDLDAILAEADAEEAARPDEPSLPPLEWMGKNLFGMGQGSPLAVVQGIILTVGSFLLALYAFRSILNFIFSENTRWDAVRVNLRLLFTQAYPEDNYTRIWVTMALVAVLAGLSLGLTKVGRGFSVKRIATWLLSWGGLIVAGVLLREPSVIKGPDGEVQLVDADGLPISRNGLGSLVYENGDPAPADGLVPIRQSWGDAMGDRTGWWIIGLVLLAIGAALWFGFGDFRRRHTFVPAIPLGLAVVAFFVSTTWWYGWGNYTFTEEGVGIEPGELVATSTRNPWTLIVLLLIGAYAVGRVFFGTERAGTVRGMVNAAWFLAPFVTFWAILRAPELDWSYVGRVDLPMWAAFAFLGAGLLWLLTRPGIGEKGRIIATALMVFAAYNWLVAFFSYDGISEWDDTWFFLEPVRWVWNAILHPIVDFLISGHLFDRLSDSIGFTHMLQKARLSFLLIGLAALLAPNFIGEARQRLRLVYGWIVFITIFHILVTLINTPSAIETPTEDFAGGFMVTIYVAIFTMLFSFPLGVLLALARTSRLPLFRVMSTVYIEAFRGVPLITMLFFFTVFVNLFLPAGMELAPFAAVTVAFVLFSAAYLAENVRGGLQAVRRGQYEASDAVGLTTVQRTAFIVLPQGLRVSIPPLVGQVIATFKETSLLAIVGIFDFLRMARDVVPAQTDFLGVQKPGLLFISVVYFIGSYSMSKYSQRLEKQLGVGER